MPYRHDTDATITTLSLSTSARVALCRSASRFGSMALLFSTYRPRLKDSGTYMEKCETKSSTLWVSRRYARSSLATCAARVLFGTTTSVGLSRAILSMTLATTKVLPVPVAPRRHVYLASWSLERCSMHCAMAVGWSPAGAKGARSFPGTRAWVSSEAAVAHKRRDDDRDISSR